MASNNNKLLLTMSVDSDTGFAGVAWRCRDMEVPIASQDTFHTSTHCPRFLMPTRFQSFTNANLTPSGAGSRLLHDSTEDVVTHPITGINNVKSKIHPAGGQDHHLSTTIDQWTLAWALIDLASWVVLNGPQIPQPLTLCSNMEQSLTLETALPPPPPPPQKPRQWKEHSPEPQQAIIPRSWPSSSVSSSSQHHAHHQQ